jgi:hypothetical protein
MPIDEPRLVAQLDNNIQKNSTQKKVPQEDFSKLLEKSRLPVHTVEKGDHLWNIVRERMYLSPERITNAKIAKNVQKLVDYNRIKTPDLIDPGQKIDLKPILNEFNTFPERTTREPVEKPAETAVDNMAQQMQPDQITETPLLAQPGEESIFPPGSKTKTVPAAETDLLRQKIDTETVPTADKTSVKAIDSQKTPCPETLSEQMAKYKVDQLMASPGGDHYFREGDSVSVRNDYSHREFKTRVGKDLSDARENIIRLIDDIGKGSTKNYIAPDGSVNTYHRLGLHGSLGNFVKNVSSGLTFGIYVPEGEEKPHGGVNRVKHFFSKIFKEGVLQDLGKSTTGAVVSGLRHSVLAAVNALEAVPDATIGNLESGRKLTTKVFDNGQVAVSYLTDVIPGGEAWFRVHSPGKTEKGSMLPVYYNLKTSEQNIDDPRWATVRNTPFRKTIESVGALISDAAMLGLAK